MCHLPALEEKSQDCKTELGFCIPIFLKHQPNSKVHSDFKVFLVGNVYSFESMPLNFVIIS